MNKPNKKQIILIIVAILISAAIIAFPFVWNAAHQNTIEEKTLTVPLSKSLTETTDTIENYAPEAGYTKYNIYKIDETWAIVWNETGSTNYLETKNMTSDLSLIYYYINYNVTSENFYTATKNNCTLAEFITAIKNKTITYSKNQKTAIGAYNMIVYKASTMVILTNPIIAGNNGTYAPKAITTYSNGQSTWETTEKYEYSTANLINVLQTTYDEGYEEGHEQGFQEGQNQISSQIIGGPQYAWENNGIDGTYNAITDELTIPETTNAQIFMKFNLSVPLKANDGVIIEWESITPTDGLNLSFSYVISNVPYSYTKITSENTGDKKATFLIPTDAVIGSEEKTTQQLLLYNNSGGTIVIKGLRIRKMSETAKQYQQGYNAGYNEGIKNAGQEYNNGYSDGLEAGRSEDTQSENFGNFIAAMFGSVLTFFLNVGNGVTIWDISLFEIAVSFIAIVVITKVVKI